MFTFLHVFEKGFIIYFRSIFVYLLTSVYLIYSYKGNEMSKVVYASVNITARKNRVILFINIAVRLISSDFMIQSSPLEYSNI